MVPSSASISDPNVITNTIVAEVLSEMADELEQAEDLNVAVHDLLRRTIREHKRVIFNGNGYSKEWEKEAERRGLPNIRSTVEAIPALISEKSIHLFEKHKVFTKSELCSRFEVLLEDYINTISLEAETMIQMAKREIFPAAMEYSTHVAQSISSILNVGVYNVDALKDLLKELTDTINSFNINLKELEKCVQKQKL